VVQNRLGRYSVIAKLASRKLKECIPYNLFLKLSEYQYWIRHIYGNVGVSRTKTTWEINAVSFYSNSTTIFWAQMKEYPNLYMAIIRSVHFVRSVMNPGQGRQNLFVMFSSLVRIVVKYVMR
jgi:hypothetical protein